LSRSRSAIRRSITASAAKLRSVAVAPVRRNAVTSLAAAASSSWTPPACAARVRSTLAALDWIWTIASPSRLGLSA